MNEGVEPGGWAGKRRAPWPLFGPFRRSLRRSNEVTRGATALLDCPRGDCMTQGSMCQAGVHRASGQAQICRLALAQPFTAAET
jgi:hypothetical protein